MKYDKAELVEVEDVLNPKTTKTLLSLQRLFGSLMCSGAKKTLLLH